MERQNIFISAVATTVSGIIVAWANKYPEVAMAILAIILMSVGLGVVLVLVFEYLQRTGSAITEWQYFGLIALIVITVWSIFAAYNDIKRSYKAVEREPGRWVIEEE